MSSPFANLRQVLSWQVVLLGVIAFGYTGVGTAFLGWINVYLVRERAVAAWRASSILSWYSIGLSAGRLALSYVPDRVRYEYLLVGAAVCSLFTAVVALTAVNELLIGTSFVLTGVAFAALLPTSLAVATRRFSHIAGTVTGLVITFGSLGRMLLPGLVGAVADYSSVTLGLRLMLVVLVAVALSAVCLAAGCAKATQLSPAVQAQGKQG